jgi:hypothetical protein
MGTASEHEAVAFGQLRTLGGGWRFFVEPTHSLPYYGRNVFTNEQARAESWTALRNLLFR